MAQGIEQTFLKPVNRSSVPGTLGDGSPELSLGYCTLTPRCVLHLGSMVCLPLTHTFKKCAKKKYSKFSGFDSFYVVNALLSRKASISGFTQNVQVGSQT